MDINQLVWTELCIWPKQNLFQAVSLLQTRKAGASSHVIFNWLILAMKVYASRAESTPVRRSMLSTASAPLIWTLVGNTLSDLFWSRFYEFVLTDFFLILPPEPTQCSLHLSTHQIQIHFSVSIEIAPWYHESMWGNCWKLLFAQIQERQICQC